VGDQHEPKKHVHVGIPHGVKRGMTSTKKKGRSGKTPSNVYIKKKKGGQRAGILDCAARTADTK